jgi:hypothetical protein
VDSVIPLIKWNFTLEFAFNVFNGLGGMSGARVTRISDAKRQQKHRQREKLLELQRSRVIVRTRDGCRLYSLPAMVGRPVDVGSVEAWLLSVLETHDDVEAEMLRWRSGDHPAAFQEGFEIVFSDLYLWPIGNELSKCLGDSRPFLGKTRPRFSTDYMNAGVVHFPVEIRNAAAYECRINGYKPQDWYFVRHVRNVFPRCMLDVPRHKIEYGALVTIPEPVLGPGGRWRKYYFDAMKDACQMAQLDRPSYESKSPHNWDDDTYRPAPRLQEYEVQTPKPDIYTGEWRQIEQAKRDTMTAKILRLIANRESKGIRLKPAKNCLSHKVRHISADYRASSAPPQELKLAARRIQRQVKPKFSETEQAAWLAANYPELPLAA